VRGHRRIATALFQKYRGESHLLELLLCIDLDAARGRILTPREYERLHPVGHRAAKRLIAEYLDTEPELRPKSERRKGNVSSTNPRKASESRGVAGNPTPKGSIQPAMRPAANPRKAHEPRGLAQNPTRDAARRQPAYIDPDPDLREEKSVGGCAAPARTVTYVPGPDPEGAQERAPEPEARRAERDRVNSEMDRALADLRSGRLRRVPLRAPRRR
jgi:hypothetical protein